MPVRNARPSRSSTFKRTGMRCATLTQLPVAFCAGSSENPSRWRRQRRDFGGDGAVRIGVDGDLRRIAFPDIGELGLLDVGLDVEIVRRHQRKGGLAGIEKGSDRDALDIIGNAVERRDDRGKAQVTRRGALVAPRESFIDRVTGK